MRAIRAEAAASPEHLVVTRVPTPVPGSGEVLVEVHAASVNRSDLLACRGILPGPFPRTLGRDFAGVVVAGADEWVGRRVWGAGGGDLGISRDGSHAEYLVLSVAAVAEMPQALSFVQAAASGLSYFTAAAAWALVGGVESGMDVVVTGAGGGVGRAAACLAKRSGARVVGVVRAVDTAATHPGPELDRVVISDNMRVADGIRSAVGKAVARAIDTVGGPLALDILDAIADGAAMCILSTPPHDRRITVDLVEFYRRELRLLGLNTSKLNAENGAAALTELFDGFATGELRPGATYATYDLEDAATAYGDVERAVEGRPVFLPHG